MKRLATGATGFVDSVLVEELERRGHEVRAFVRPGRGAALSKRGFDIAEGDITDVSALEDASASSERNQPGEFAARNVFAS